MSLSPRLALMATGLALAACGDKDTTGAPDSGVPHDSGDGSADVTADCAGAEGVWFTAADGTVEDWTATFASGSAGAPVEVMVERDGVVDVCGGTWVVNLTVSAASLTVRGDATRSAPTLDGGGSGPIIDLTTVGSRLVVEDLTLTNARACFGSGIRGADFSAECDREAGPLGADVTVRRSHLHGLTYDIGGGAIGTAGSTVVVEDTLIANNEGHGVFAVATDVRCSAASGLDAGMRDNTKSGVWVADPTPEAGNSLVSEGCDWGGNGQEDVRLGGETYFNDFGQDARFQCDALALTCG